MLCLKLCSSQARRRAGFPNTPSSAAPAATAPAGDPLVTLSHPPAATLPESDMRQEKLRRNVHSQPLSEKGPHLRAPHRPRPGGLGCKDVSRHRPSGLGDGEARETRHVPQPAPSAWPPPSGPAGGAGPGAGRRFSYRPWYGSSRAAPRPSLRLAFLQRGLLL